MAINEALRQQISGIVTNNRVVLFMKGNREQPQCGFSAQVVQILDELLPRYETVDVLRSPELREGIKQYSEWPTIPQLYVEGRFIGGCDIVKDLHASGELREVLGAAGGPPEQPAAPVLTVSESAARAFAEHLADLGDDVLRLEIDGGFKHDLFFGPSAASDLKVSAAGLTFHLDPASARRASGVSIDFIPGPDGGFKINNPNQPPAVKELTAPEVKQLLDRGELLLFDVRPEAESARAKIAAGRSLDAAGQEFLRGLPRDTPIAFYCHHGMRSRSAAEQVLAHGFKNVHNLKGGIDAWSLEVDPSVPRY
jgi:monothiol glutaredoxin